MSSVHEYLSQLERMLSFIFAIHAYEHARNQAVTCYRYVRYKMLNQISSLLAEPGTDTAWQLNIALTYMPGKLVVTYLHYGYSEILQIYSQPINISIL